MGISHPFPALDEAEAEDRRVDEADLRADPVEAHRRDGEGDAGAPREHEPDAARVQLEALLREDRAERVPAPAWIPKLQPDFNVRVLERFGPDSLAVLRELDESNRFAQKSAESTLI